MASPGVRGEHSDMGERAPHAGDGGHLEQTVPACDVPPVPDRESATGDLGNVRFRAIAGTGLWITLR